MRVCHKHAMIACRPVLRALVLVALVVFASAIGGAAVERRMASPDEQARWGAVGRLNVTGQGYCTATLIAPDIVLTAAHCVMNRRTGAQVQPADLHFLPGFRAGAYLAHGRGHRIGVMPGYDRARNTMHRDLALIQLRDPMPASIVPARLLEGARTQPRFSLLSYGMDRSQLLSAEHDCRVSKREGALLFTTCTGLPGMSGAPLMQMVEGQPVLVAVVSSIRAARKRPVPQGQVLAVEVSLPQIDQLRREVLTPPSVPVPTP